MYMVADVFLNGFHPSHSASPHDCIIQTGLPITTVLSWRAGLERSANFLKPQSVLDPHRLLPFTFLDLMGGEAPFWPLAANSCQGSNVSATGNCIL